MEMLQDVAEKNARSVRHLLLRPTTSYSGMDGDFKCSRRLYYNKWYLLAMISIFIK